MEGAAVDMVADVVVDMEEAVADIKGAAVDMVVDVVDMEEAVEGVDMEVVVEVGDAAMGALPMRRQTSPSPKTKWPN